MLKFIDGVFNKITMYRMMLYFLCGLWFTGFILSFFDIFYFGPWDLLFSTVVILIASWVSNTIFSKLWRVPTNNESLYITAFILSLIISPPTGVAAYLGKLEFLVLVAVIAQASKYILTIRGRHIFNPAALAILATSLTIGGYASWWGSSSYLIIPIVIGGLLIVRKIQRLDLLISFLITAVITSVWVAGVDSVGLVLQGFIQYSPILFFSFVMLTEPLTTPGSRCLRIIYGVLIGLLFSIPFNIGALNSSPQLALLVGNLIGFLMDPQGKLRLKLIHKTEIAQGVHEFVFEPNRKVSFKPGQHLEWTISGTDADKRGNRRYFTVASSPTESHIHLGVKFYPNPSTFKQKLIALNPGESILASHVAGDFVLPTDKNRKLAFVAGGIGITPFRSMLQHMIDKAEQRDVKLLYSNKRANEVAYKDVLNVAEAELGVQISYVVTEEGGKSFDRESIIEAVPDFRERLFYISGPRGFVEYIEKNLHTMGVRRSNIKTDFFPGYV